MLQESVFEVLRWYLRPLVETGISSELRGRELHSFKAPRVQLSETIRQISD